MPKSPLFHASERIDKTDIDQIFTYADDSVSLHRKIAVLDNQSRIVRGFRVEIADQTSYPGRITIHGGEAIDFDGKILLNEDQPDVSRTITLEGASTNFFVEIEFIESESDSDARAFWDPTIDQGTDTSGDDLPDGQELSTTVSTRKTPDWRIVQPVSTTGFQRDSAGTINSSRVPILRIRTDVANEITVGENPNLSTEKAATVILQQLSATQLRVQSTQLFRVGYDIEVSQYLGIAETSTVTAVDHDQNLLTITSIDFTGNHQPGAIVRITDASAPNFITETSYGRYRKDAIAASSTVDWRDKFLQGDEVHGNIVSQGFSDQTDRSDTNLRALKDHIDFLAYQLYELKWGHASPYTALDDSSRAPVGTGTYSTFPSQARYYDRSDGVMGSRNFMVTIGDGTNSYGDLNGTDQDVINTALGVLPAAGGTILIKKGTYTLTSNVSITSSGKVTIAGEPGTNITCNGGNVLVNMSGSLILKDIELTGTTTSTTSLLIDTTAPSGLILDNVTFTDGRVITDVVLPDLTTIRNCTFSSTQSWMATLSLLAVNSNSGELNGIISNCNFNHVASTASNAVACIDLQPASSSAGTNYLKVENCKFFATNVNATTGSLIDLYYDPQNAIIDNCEFNCTGAAYHIRSYGGSNLKILNSRQLDTVATFISFEYVTNSLIFGNNIGDQSNYVNTTSITLLDSSTITISKNIFYVGSSTSLTNAAIKASTAGGSIDEITIERNTIIGDSITNNSTTGIIFDIATSSSLNYIKIINNYLAKLETCIYFNNSAGTGTYEGTVIQSNNFEGSAHTKIGIIAVSAAIKQQWIIDSNTFNNIQGTGTLLSRGRIGILIQGDSNQQISITNNSFKDIGDTGFSVEGYAIDFPGEADNSLISNNYIFGLVGTEAVAIRCGSSNLTSSFITITGNHIEGCTGSTSFAGVRLDGVTDSCISNNIIYGQQTAASVLGLIYIQGSSTNVERLNIQGNCLRNLGSQRIHGIHFDDKPLISDSNIIGNTINDVYNGVMIESPSGQWLRVRICNNHITANKLNAHGIRIDNTVSDGGSRGVIIEGNTISVTAVTTDSYGIEVGYTSQFTVANNFVEFYNGGADPIGMWFPSSSLYSVHGNHTYRGTGVATAHIKSDGASNLAFNIMSNVLEEQNTSNSNVTIDTNNAGNPNIVGLNFKRSAASIDPDTAGQTIDTTVAGGQDAYSF